MSLLAAIVMGLLAFWVVAAVVGALNTSGSEKMPAGVAPMAPLLTPEEMQARAVAAEKKKAEEMRVEQLVVAAYAKIEKELEGKDFTRACQALGTKWRSKSKASAESLAALSRYGTAVHGFNTRDEDGAAAKTVQVGMTRCGALASWGRPDRVNRSVYASGTREQWVYDGEKNVYLYFDGERLTSYQN